MAKENIAFLVNLRKNTAVGTDREGRYYPEAESKEALTTKGFAKHVSEHGGLVTYEFMQLVLASIVKCLKEMMSQGQPVKLDGLGTFRPTVTSVKNGAASIEEALTMGVNNMVAGVNFVFIPENAQGEEITSKKFKEQCSLQFAYLVETIKKTINGKEKSYTLRTPLSAYGIIDAETDAEGGGSNSGTDSGGSQGGTQTGDNTQGGGSDNTGGGDDQGGGNSSITPGEGD
jgi:nucleoid DNA-binding protein